MDERFDERDIDNTSFSIGCFHNEFLQSIKLIDFLKVHWRYLTLLGVWIVDKLALSPIIKYELTYLSNNIKLALEYNSNLCHLHE